MEMSGRTLWGERFWFFFHTTEIAWACRMACSSLLWVAKTLFFPPIPLASLFPHHLQLHASSLPQCPCLWSTPQRSQSSWESPGVQMRGSGWDSGPRAACPVLLAARPLQVGCLHPRPGLKEPCCIALQTSWLCKAREKLKSDQLAYCHHRESGAQAEAAFFLQISVRI